MSEANVPAGYAGLEQGLCARQSGEFQCVGLWLRGGVRDGGRIGGVFRHKYRCFWLRGGEDCGPVEKAFGFRVDLVTGEEKGDDVLGCQIVP